MGSPLGGTACAGRLSGRSGDGGSAGGIGAGAGGGNSGGPRLPSFRSGYSRWICSASGGFGRGSGAARSCGRGEGGRLAAAGRVLGRARAGGWDHDGGTAAGGRGRGGDGGAYVTFGPFGGGAARRQRGRELCAAWGGSARGTTAARSRAAAGPRGNCGCGIGREEPRTGLPEAARGGAFNRRRSGGD